MALALKENMVKGAILLISKIKFLFKLDNV